MIVLCSNGLSSQTLLDEVKNVLNKNSGCAALVVTADNQYKAQNYHVSKCVNELELLGFKVDLFDLDTQPADDLLKYDAVEFIGGNPFYLLTSIRNSQSEEILKTIASKKLLIGWSAAAFVFSPTLALVNQYSHEMNFLGLTDLNALNLTDIQVLPHYSRFLAKFERFEERCCDYEKINGVSVIRLNDGDGVISDGEEIRVCRA